MIWDGQCEFCNYWVKRWQRLTGEKIRFVPYQQVLEQFPDINSLHFEAASQLVEKDGSIYSGPWAVYRLYTIANKYAFLEKLYIKGGIFQKLSDLIYFRITKNRSFTFKLTTACFGTDPNQTRPFWAIYLFVIGYLIYSLIAY